jgi:hypothetical protein
MSGGKINMTKQREDRTASFRWGFPRWRLSNIEKMGLGRAVERLHEVGHSEREIASLLAINSSSVHRHLAKKEKR